MAGTHSSAKRLWRWALRLLRPRPLAGLVPRVARRWLSRREFSDFALANGGVLPTTEKTIRRDSDGVAWSYSCTTRHPEPGQLQQELPATPILETRGVRMLRSTHRLGLVAARIDESGDREANHLVIIAPQHLAREYPDDH